MPVTPPLASWDTQRQSQYHARSPLTIHLLLDASASMIPYAEALRTCYTKYWSYLRHHAPRGTRLDQRCFHVECPEPQPVDLHTSTPLVYRPVGGTHLYDAIGSVIGPSPAPGRHLLIVLSDGEDGLDEYGSREWSAAQVKAVLAGSSHEHQDWLCVFLGAFPEALPVAQAMGFHEGNCLTFDTAHFPEAFALLTDATGRYLHTATPQERKLLAQRGLFQR